MDCLRPVGDFCVAEASPNFRVGINKPMADFIMERAGLINPSLPTRMIFVEEWLDVSEGKHTGGYTAISEDGFDQIIVISLKSAALQAIKDIDRRNLSLEQTFNGAVSYTVSSIAAHEFGHAGSQTKRLLKPGMSMILDSLLDATHPQIFGFQRRYENLYNAVFSRGLGAGALIFVVNLEKDIYLQAYREKILQEAKDLGID